MKIENSNCRLVFFMIKCNFITEILSGKKDVERAESSK